MKVAVIENNIIATNTIRNKLMMALQEKGFELLILSTGTSEGLQVAASSGFRVIDIKASTQDPRDIIRYVNNLMGALKAEKPDVVLTYTIRPAIWGNIVTRILKIPTITNITGIGPLFDRNNVAYRGARTLYKFVLKKTFRIFFQNNDDLKIFVEKKFVKPENAIRIPGSGIDHHHFSPQPRTEKRFIFLFISRLIKDKGIIEFVEAARMLGKKIDATFMVAGPLWIQNLKDNIITKSELEGWQREGIIEYVGELQDVRPFIANASCIVLPSYREGSSNVLLEASSMERACITCDTTGCNEIVENNVTGFLCNVKDARDLARKMEDFYNLSREEQTTMGRKARIKVVKEYDKQIVIDAYLKAIEEAVK